MSTQADSNWQQVRSYLKAFPLDLVIVLGFVGLLTSSVALLPDGPLWRFLIGGFLLVFVPGYALLAAIFPGNGPQSRESRLTDLDGVAVNNGIMLGERLPLSFGISVTLIPLFALLLAAVGVTLTASSVIGILSVFTVGCVVVALFRRLRLPVTERFRLPVDEWVNDTRTFLFGGSAMDSLVNIVLVVSILVGVSAAAYAMSVPQPDAEFTSFALMTRSESGEYVSSGYPTNFTQGEPRELVVSVTNNRRETTEYTVVAELQQVRTNSEERLRVLSQREQRRFTVELEPNESWQRPHEITPERAGTNLRLVYFLYRGDAPAEPSTSTADKRLQLWINASTRVPQNNTSTASTDGPQNNSTSQRSP